ncbi:SCO1664 family protein [Enteractinococcus coprophilus]|uniref:Putative repeat protein (TIGR03843 family) n=1 Tax=Enteractinococcus coprophilus TaxID=1027633 RepID=A0A543AMF3_9MICC|nr:SCO1664 family protein [Enteractinococcus coprophilus]TQL73762.1 putative repeat protein (TIGR03843 family) [Enteractinococcus coprophilus]
MMQESEVPTPHDNSLVDAEVLRCGQFRLLGQLANSSNETFLVEVTDGDVQLWGIYKPELGERPLMDFEHGLHRREFAAYLLSEALGWRLVPATVIRDDGPLGVGSLQLFIDHNPAEHYFTLLEHKPETYQQLRCLALFDLIANNADRKSGHVLYDDQGKIWGIDHGLCFAAPMKLRTVMWEFADEDIAQELLDDIAPFAERIPATIAQQLSSLETSALQSRVQKVLDTQKYPRDITGRRFPWPLI